MDNEKTIFQAGDLSVHVIECEHVRHFVFVDRSVEIFRVTTESDLVPFATLLNVIVGYSISHRARSRSFNKITSEIARLARFVDENFQDGISVKLPKHSQAT